jgi:hypothetical protein
MPIAIADNRDQKGPTSVKCTIAKEPDQTHDDQVDRDDVIEQSGHDKDEDACDERK